VASAATATVLNVNDAPTGTLALTGTVQQGTTLRVSSTLADADGLGTLTYRWQSSADAASGPTSPVPAATASRPAKPRSGSSCGCWRAGPTAGARSNPMTSAASTAVANVNDAPTGTVKLAGTAEQGQLLSASNQLADADGLGTIRYEWQSSSDGSQWLAITGASAASFTPGLAQVGQQLRVAGPLDRRPWQQRSGGVAGQQPACSDARPAAAAPTP
jgi:hypothetical protein